MAAQANKHATTQSGHSWTDTYFDDKVAPEDLVAVFDWNYDGMKRIYNCFAVLYVVSFLSMIFALYFFLISETDDAHMTIFGLLVLFLAAMTFGPVKNCISQAKNVDGIHVAVTSQGVRYDRIYFPSASSYHTSTMIEYHEIDRIYVMPLFYRVCGPNGVHIVAKADHTNLTLLSVADPEGFVALVLTGMMKQQQQPKPAIVTDALWSKFR